MGCGVRNEQMDGAKFLMVVFVVVIHMSHWHVGKHTWPASAVSKALGFQMPLLCMLSGAVSAGRPGRSHLRLLRLAVPCVVFGNCMPSQYWLLWYLRCLILWRLAAPWLERLPLAARALVAVAAGLSGAYSAVFAAALGLEGPEAAVDAIRAGAMMPYFVLGMHLDWERLAPPKTSAPSRGQGLLIGWVAFLGFVLAYLAFEADIDRILLRADWWLDIMWFSGLCGHCGNAADWVWARYVADVVLNVVLGLLFFTWCVPRRSSFVSWYGAHTLYPYVLHDRFLWVFLGVWRKLLGGKSPASGTLAGCSQVAGWGLLSLVMALLLASWPVRTVFGWAVEPRWLPAVLRRPAVPAR